MTPFRHGTVWKENLSLGSVVRQLLVLDVIQQFFDLDASV